MNVLSTLLLASLLYLSPISADVASTDKSIYQVLYSFVPLLDDQSAVETDATKLKDKRLLIVRALGYFSSLAADTTGTAFFAADRNGCADADKPAGVACDGTAATNEVTTFDPTTFNAGTTDGVNTYTGFKPSVLEAATSIKLNKGVKTTGALDLSAASAVLTSLDVSDNKFTITDFVKASVVHTLLATLNLSKNKMTTGIALDVTTAVAYPALTKVDLSYNDLAADLDLEAVFGARQDSILEVKIGNNMIKSKDGKSLKAGLAGKYKALTHLEINDNAFAENINTWDPTTFYNMAADTAAASLVDTDTKLTNLDISNNCLIGDISLGVFPYNLVSLNIAQTQDMGVADKNSFCFKADSFLTDFAFGGTAFADKKFADTVKTSLGDKYNTVEKIKALSCDNFKDSVPQAYGSRYSGKYPCTEGAPAPPEGSSAFSPMNIVKTLAVAQAVIFGLLM